MANNDISPACIYNICMVSSVYTTLSKTSNCWLKQTKVSSYHYFKISYIPPTALTSLKIIQNKTIWVIPLRNT